MIIHGHADEYRRSFRSPKLCIPDHVADWAGTFAPRVRVEISVTKL